MAQETVLDRLVTEVLFREDKAGVQRIERTVEKLRGRLDTFSRTAGLIGGAITGVATATVTAFARYESKLATMEGLVGVSRDQLDAWQGDFQRISDETGQGMEALADAMFFITSAGFEGEEALELLELSAKSATAGLGEQKTIADLLTSAMGAYGDEATPAAEATDQLVAAIREGKLEPETLAGALASVLPFAAELGVEFGEVAGAMSAMSKQGIKADKSATALRGIFNKLIKPTEAGKKALDEVGLSFDDIKKAVGEQGLLPGLRTIVTAFGDNEEALGKVFEDSEALLGVLALTGPAYQDNVDTIHAVTSAYGDLDAAVKPVTETLQFKFDKVLANVGQSLIQLGDKLKAPAGALLDFANEMFDRFQALSDGPLGDFIAWGLMAGPVLLGLAAGAKILSLGLGWIAPLLTKVAAGGSLLGGALRFALRFAGPLGLAASVVLAAWKPISTFFSGLGQTIAGAFADVEIDEDGQLVRGPGAIRAALDRLGEAFGPILDSISSAFGRVREAWTALIAPFQTDETATGRAWGDAIVAGAVAVIDSIARVASGWDAMMATLRAVGSKPEGWLTWVSEAVEAPFGWLSDAWAAAIGAVGSKPEGWLTWLSEAVVAPFQWLMDAWGAAVGLVGARPEGWLMWVSEAVVAPFQWLSDAWAAAIGLVGARPEGWLTWLSETVVAPFRWLSDAWAAAIGAIGRKPEGWLTWLSEVVETPFRWLSDAWAAAIGAVGRKPEGWLGWLSETVEAPFGWLTNAWGAAVGAVGRVPATTWDGIAAGVPDVFGWLDRQWSDVLAGLQGESAIRTAITGVLASMAIAVGSLDFGGIGTTIGTLIGDGLVFAAGSLTDLLDQVNLTVASLDWQSLGGMVGGWIGAAIVRGISALTGLLEAMTAAVASIDFFTLGDVVGEGIGGRVVAGISALTGLLPALATVISTIDFERVGATIGSAIRVVMVGSITLLTGLVTGLVRAVLATDWTTVGSAIWDAIWTAVRAAADLAVGLWKGLFGDPGDAIAEITEALAGIEKTINEWLASYSPDWDALRPDWTKGWFGDGEAATKTIGEGMAAAAPEAEKGWLESMKWWDDNEPQSDARRGPFSRLTAAGEAVVRTLGEGMLRAGPGALQAAFSSALALPIGPALSAPGAGPVAGPAAAGGGGVSVTIERIEIHMESGATPAETAADTVSEVQREIREAMRELDSGVSH